jgi:hypothetical protein
MNYQIKYGPDEDFPRQRSWVLCRQPDVTTLYLRRSMTQLGDLERARILEEAWAGYRVMLEDELDYSISLSA